MQDATPIPPCPRCHATHVVRNGRLRSGSPQLLCRGCGRRFVPDPKRAPVTDDREEAVVPEERHASAGKEAGLTNHVERFGLTVWQRCGRFVRKTLSFSKCPLNHVGSL